MIHLLVLFAFVSLVISINKNANQTFCFDEKQISMEIDFKCGYKEIIDVKMENFGRNSKKNTNCTKEMNSECELASDVIETCCNKRKHCLMVLREDNAFKNCKTLKMKTMYLYVEYKCVKGKTIEKEIDCDYSKVPKKKTEKGPKEKEKGSPEVFWISYIFISLAILLAAIRVIIKSYRKIKKKKEDAKSEVLYLSSQDDDKKLEKAKKHIKGKVQGNKHPTDGHHTRKYPLHFGHKEEPHKHGILEPKLHKEAHDTHSPKFHAETHSPKIHAETHSPKIHAETHSPKIHTEKQHIDHTPHVKQKSIKSRQESTDRSPPIDMETERPHSPFASPSKAVVNTQDVTQRPKLDVAKMDSQHRLSTEKNKDPTHKSHPMSHKERRSTSELRKKAKPSVSSARKPAEHRRKTSPETARTEHRKDTVPKPPSDSEEDQG